MLVITFKDGTTKKYKNSKFTDYYYDRKSFVVIYKKQWIGVYNLDSLISVEYKKKS